MINPQQLAPLFLALALGAAPLLAQPDAAGTAGSPSGSADNGAKEQPAAPEQSPAASEPEPNSSSASKSTDSPFDYRSSEKISEDVPVSFPVDI